MSLHSIKKEIVTIPSDLLTANKLAYEPSGLHYTNLTKEAESEEYGAFEFDMNCKRIKFRVGKITPTKVGLFVTLWKRNDKGITEPPDINDPFDFFVISVRNGERFGQFVFSKTLLLQKGIVANNGVGGKRGIRIYPAWDVTDSPQARRTQAWQTLYFFEIHPEENINPSIVQKLFNDE